MNSMMELLFVTQSLCPTCVEGDSPSTSFGPLYGSRLVLYFSPLFFVCMNPQWPHRRSASLAPHDLPLCE